MRNVYLSKLHIENYRAILSATISCEDGITVLIGENGCGKSSILNALEACLGRKLKGENFDIKSSDFFNDFKTSTQARRLIIELFFASGSGQRVDDPVNSTMDGLEKRGDAPGGGRRSAELFKSVSALEKTASKLVEATAKLAESTSKMVASNSKLAETNAKMVASNYSLTAVNDKMVEANEALLESNAKMVSTSTKLVNSTSQLMESTSSLVEAASLAQEELKVTVDAELLQSAELLRDGQPEFSLLLECIRDEDDRVRATYRFLNSQREEVLAHQKAALLGALRRFCPFIRIRSSVLSPPSFDRAEKSAGGGEAAKQQVEKIILQAYGDLLREADYSAEHSLRQNSNMMNSFYENLDELFKNSTPDVKERLSAPLSPLNSWLHYVSMLRGSGARSVAMLYFAGAFLKARASEMLGNGMRPILSIEYPEANLHPLMLTSLWNLIDRLPTQMLVTTYCVELLSAIPFRSLRRIVRSYDGKMDTYQVPVEKVNKDDMRRIAYHLRVRRGTALFMRVWMLVEGETEYWLLPEIARSMGFDLWQEGVEFIEFAQCGLEPLVRLANYLGINWFLLCDGDKAGQSYSEKAEKFAKASNGLGHVVRLSSVDIEHSFWDNGYADVFIEASGIAKETVAQSPQHQLAINANKKNLAKSRAKALEKSREVIKRAVKKVSKPGMALLLGKAVVDSGLGIPSDIENFIFNAVRVARETGGSEGSLMENCKPTLPQLSETDIISSTYTIADTPLELSDDPIEDWGYDISDLNETSEETDGEAEAELGENEDEAVPSDNASAADAQTEG